MHAGHRREQSCHAQRHCSEVQSALGAASDAARSCARDPRRVHGSSIRARGARTRSCSWSRSAACSRDRLHRPRLAPGDQRRLQRPARALALVHGAVRQLRRGDGRRPRQGPGRHAAQDRRPTRWRVRRSTARASRCRSAAARKPATSCRRGRRPHPRRRRVSRASPRSTSRRSPASRAPVVREAGGDRSAVTGGTRVLSDWL